MVREKFGWKVQNTLDLTGPGTFSYWDFLRLMGSEEKSLEWEKSCMYGVFFSKRNDVEKRWSLLKQTFLAFFFLIVHIRVLTAPRKINIEPEHFQSPTRHVRAMGF